MNSFSSIRKNKVNHQCLMNIKKKSANCMYLHLENIPQDLIQDIENLYLRFNRIRYLHNTSFQKYPHLIKVDLNTNPIVWIQEGTFYPLVNLETLILSNTVRMLHLPSGSFLMSLRLQQLNLIRCSLTSFLLSGAFTHRPNLGVGNTEFDGKSSKNFPFYDQHQMDFIALTGNNFESLTRETIAIDWNVNTLILIDNPIQTVDPDTIASLHVKWLQFGDYPLSLEVIKNITLGVSKSTVIERLDIQYSNIRHIPSNLFEHLRNKSLASLSLGGNNIVFYQEVFKDLTHVFSLNLSNCGFTIIDPGYFDGMTDLRVLYAGSKQLSSVNPHNLPWRVNLDELFLGLFQCANISEYAFRGLHNLTKLFLTSDNKGDVYKNDDFVVNHAKLQHFFFDSSTVWRPILRLAAPNLKTFYYRCASGDYFNFDFNAWEVSHAAQSIKTVTIHAGLMVFEIFHKSYTNRSLFSDMPKLIRLDLSGNKFIDLDPDLFVNLSSLTSLDLSHNEMETISADAFMGLISLETLNLSDNALFFLPDEFAIHLKSLQNLYLDLGELYNVGNESTGLTTLILANNLFAEFNRSSLQPLFSSLTSVDISGNRLMCNCELKWLVEEFDRSLLNEATTLCSTSVGTLEPLRGKPITMLNVDKYCSLPIRLYLGISAAVFSMLVLSVAFIISYHHRWLLRYKLFLLKLAILGYREIQDGREREEFEFDINIMFFDGDEEWAANTLRPELERRLQKFGRIAFGDNELILGMHYFDAVYYNVEKSFKTILLLSRAAVQDHIFMTKFRIAMNHVTDTETQNMILVFLEDIPDQELPHLVRLHLSGQGAFLRWEEDEEGQEYFWNKITKHLNSNLRVNHLIPPE